MWYRFTKRGFVFILFFTFAVILFGVIWFSLALRVLANTGAAVAYSSVQSALAMSIAQGRQYPTLSMLVQGLEGSDISVYLEKSAGSERREARGIAFSSPAISYVVPTYQDIVCQRFTQYVSDRVNCLGKVQSQISWKTMLW